MPAHDKKNGISGVISTIPKASRPLNSFMAFRAYYAPIFISTQQKFISGLLTHLWDHDLSKDKWTIIAKAYSIIRDKIGKENASLPVFLAISALYMGVTEPEVYLVSHGWEIATGKDGSSVLRRTNGFAGNQNRQSVRTTIASVHDVLYNSFARSYISQDVFDEVKHGNEVALTMATSAHASNVTASDASVTTGTARGRSLAITDLPIQADQIAVEAVMASHQLVDLNGNVIVSPKFPVADQGTMSTGSTKAADLKKKSTIEKEWKGLAGNYPFHNHFDPKKIHSTFDPFAYDRFDAYDISDLHDKTQDDWFENPKSKDDKNPK
ncbi:hypothetical protein MMC07_003282 [Pseudocyphellaria aurata]|nr:hypothetical protein [Pseudocyphellaria aurata]